MSVDTVIKKIQQKSADEICAIRTEAQAKAAEIKQVILDDANRKAAEILNNAQAVAELTVRAGRQQDALEARIGELGKKREIMDKVALEAKQALKNLTAQQWAKGFTKFVASSGITGKVEIICSDEDKARLSDKKLCGEVFDFDGTLTEYWGKDNKATFVVSDKKLSDEGGIILSGEKFDVDLTFDTLISEAYNEHERDISDVLFGKGTRR